MSKSADWSAEDRRSRASGPGNRDKGFTKKGPRDEARDAIEARDDSCWGKNSAPRPTADEVINNVDGAANVPFGNLPEKTQDELRRRAQQSDGPQPGMFKGEETGVGVRDPDTGRG